LHYLTGDFAALPGRAALKNMQPLAVELYYRVVGGESAEQLSRELGIPLDRVKMRLKAAEAYLRQAGPVPLTPSTSEAGDL
jgi:hypothetical protein